MRADRRETTPTRRAAVQFLCSGVDARPVIRSIDELDRLDEWLDVAITLGIDGPQRRALRQRRAAVRRNDADVEFHQASEIATSDGRGHETEVFMSTDELLTDDEALLKHLNEEADESHRRRS